MHEFEIVDGEWIKLTSGLYEGVVFKYGRVQFNEEGDHLKLSYDYEVREGSPDDEFGQYIGPILVDLIESGVAKNSIVYTGGMDEN